MKFGVVLPSYSPQAGGPELWVGGNSPAALKRAVLPGDGWHPNQMKPEAFSERLRVIQAAGLQKAILVIEAPSNAARERAPQTIARQIIPALR